MNRYTVVGFYEQTEEVHVTHEQAADAEAAALETAPGVRVVAVFAGWLIDKLNTTSEAFVRAAKEG